MQYIEVTASWDTIEEYLESIPVRWFTFDEMNHNDCGKQPEAGI